MASDVICVDLDFTLVRYRQPAFTELQYLSMARGMVEMGYCAQLLEREWMDRALEFAQNGLVADLKRGNVVSLGRGSEVRSCYHGFQRKSEAEVREMYGDPPLFPISSSYNVPHLYWIFLTHYATAESALYQACVHSLALGLSPLQSLSTLGDHLYLCACERFDSTCPYSFLPDLYQQPEVYIEKEGKLVELLQWLGRPVVIVTNNSQEEHVNALCSYALGEGWRGLFELVVLAAGKPGYFGQDSQGSYTDSGMLVGGSYRDLEARFPGKAFTYIGDHFINDVSASTAALNWTSIAVIPELETETAIPPAYLPHFGPFLHPDNYWISLVNAHSHGQFPSLEAFLRSLSPQLDR